MFVEFTNYFAGVEISAARAWGTTLSLFGRIQHTLDVAGRSLRNVIQSGFFTMKQ